MDFVKLLFFMVFPVFLILYLIASISERRRPKIHRITVLASGLQPGDFLPAPNCGKVLDVLPGHKKTDSGLLPCVYVAFKGVYVRQEFSSEELLEVDRLTE